MKIDNTMPRQGGTYVIKAAESQPRPVVPKPGGSSVAPTGNDRSLVQALIKYKAS